MTSNTLVPGAKPTVTYRDIRTSHSRSSHGSNGSRRSQSRPLGTHIINGPSTQTAFAKTHTGGWRQASPAGVESGFDQQNKDFSKMYSGGFGRKIPLQECESFMPSRSGLIARGIPGYGGWVSGLYPENISGE